jgi:hypothetical protein
MTESEAVEGQAFRAERTDDEVVLRFPSLNRLVRAFLPAEAVKHLYAAQREQLLAVRSVVDAIISYVEVAEREGGAGAPRRTEIRVN